MPEVENPAEKSRVEHIVRLGEVYSYRINQEATILLGESFVTPVQLQNAAGVKSILVVPDSVQPGAPHIDNVVHYRSVNYRNSAEALRSINWYFEHMANARVTSPMSAYLEAHLRVLEQVNLLTNDPLIDLNRAIELALNEFNVNRPATLEQQAAFQEIIQLQILSEVTPTAVVNRLNTVAALINDINAFQLRESLNNDLPANPLDLGLVTARATPTFTISIPDGNAVVRNRFTILTRTLDNYERVTRIPPSANPDDDLQHHRAILDSLRDDYRASGFANAHPELRPPAPPAPEPEPEPPIHPAPENPPPVTPVDKVTIGLRSPDVVRERRGDVRLDRDEYDIEPDRFDVLSLLQIPTEWVISRPARAIGKSLSKKEKGKEAPSKGDTYSLEDSADVDGLSLRTKHWNREVAVLVKTPVVEPGQRTLNVYYNETDDNRIPYSVFETVQRLRTEARLCGRPTTLLLEPLIILAGIRLFASQSEMFFPKYEDRINFLRQHMRKSLTYNPDRRTAWKGFPENSQELENIIFLTEQVIKKIGKYGPSARMNMPDRIDITPAGYIELRAVAKKFTAYIKLADQAYIARMMKNARNSVRHDTFYIPTAQFDAVAALAKETITNDFDDPLTKTRKEKIDALKRAKGKPLAVAQATLDQVTLIAGQCEQIMNYSMDFKELTPQLKQAMARFFNRTAEIRVVAGLPLVAGSSYFAIANGKIDAIKTLIGTKSAPTFPEAEAAVRGFYVRIPLSAIAWFGVGKAETELGEWLVSQLGSTKEIAAIVPAVLFSLLVYVATNFEIIRGYTATNAVLPDVKPAIARLTDKPSWAGVAAVIADITADIAARSNLGISLHLLPPTVIPIIMQLFEDHKTRQALLKVLRRAMVSSVTEAEGPLKEALAAWGFPGV